MVILLYSSIGDYHRNGVITTREFELSILGRCLLVPGTRGGWADGSF